MIGRPWFDLVDHHGRSVTPESFAGHRCLVFFGFTHCKVVCPRALAKLTDALALIGDDGHDVQGLYISVDPERDTPRRLAEFLQSYPRFLGLTGSVEQAAAARESFGVHVRRRADPDDAAGHAVPHSALTYLLSVDGTYAGHWLDSAAVDEIAAGLRTRQRDEGPSVQDQSDTAPVTASCCCPPRPTQGVELR